jgi:hypothetical protein
MSRWWVAVLCLLAAASVGIAGWAAEAEVEPEGGLSATIGAWADVLPAFGGGVWFDLDWDVGGWGIRTETEIGVFPAFDARWTGTVDTTFGPVDLWAMTAIDVVPFAFAGLDLFAGVGLVDVERSGFALTIDAGLLAEILPAFGTTWTLGVDASYGPVSVWADLDVAIPGFGVTVASGAEVLVLDLDLENGELTIDLGASSVLLPAVDARFWFDVGLRLGTVTVTAETEFELTPFGLADQRIEIELPIDGLSIVAWFGFTGDGDPTAGIRVTYRFP